MRQKINKPSLRRKHHKEPAIYCEGCHEQTEQNYLRAEIENDAKHASVSFKCEFCKRINAFCVPLEIYYKGELAMKQYLAHLEADKA